MRMETTTLPDRKRYTFNNGTIIDVFNGWLEIEVEGRRYAATPEDNPEYRARAKELGFVKPTGEIDVWAMCRAHDLAHARFAEIMGLSHSPALLAASRREPISELTGAEEAFILAHHRYFNLLKAQGFV
jgi:hypothetical protein